MTSPLDSWHHLTIYLNVNALSSLESLLIKASSYLLQLKEKKIAEMWHYRFGGSWITYRVHASSGFDGALDSALNNIGNKLCSSKKEQIALDYSDTSRKWYRDCDSVVEKHGNRSQWMAWMETLFHVTRMVEILADSNTGYRQGVHHFLNMIGCQDIGIYRLKSDKLNSIEGTLGKQQFHRLLDYARIILKNEDAKKFLRRVNLFAVIFFGNRAVKW